MIILLLLISSAQAFEVKELSLELERFILPERALIAEMPGYLPKESVAVNVDTRLIGPIGWRFTVHALTEPAQYRLVGLGHSLYISPRRWVELGYFHHSQHLLDARHPSLKFMVQDTLYLKLYFIRAD